MMQLNRYPENETVDQEAEPMRGSKIALRMYVGLCVVVGVVVAMNVELEC